MTKHSLAIASMALALLLGADLSVAQAPPPEGPPPAPPPGPNYKQSMALATAALEACAGMDAAVAVSVVDSEGRPRITLVADGMGGNPATSVRKANTARKYNMIGTDMEAKEKDDQAFAAEIAADPVNLNAHSGSRPLLSGGKVIGGIGISGTSHATAQQCVDAAVSKTGAL